MYNLEKLCPTCLRGTDDIYAMYKYICDIENSKSLAAKLQRLNALDVTYCKNKFHNFCIDCHNDLILTLTLIYCKRINHFGMSKYEQILLDGEEKMEEVLDSIKVCEKIVDLDKLETEKFSKTKNARKLPRTTKNLGLRKAKSETEHTVKNASGEELEYNKLTDFDISKYKQVEDIQWKNGEIKLEISDGGQTFLTLENNKKIKIKRIGLILHEKFIDIPITVDNKEKNVDLENVGGSNLQTEINASIEVSTIPTVLKQDVGVSNLQTATNESIDAGITSSVSKYNQLNSTDTKHKKVQNRSEKNINKKSYGKGKVKKLFS